MKKNDISLEKKLLRKQLLEKRNSLSPALARKWSAWVQMHFLGAHCYLNATTIGLYASFDQEVDTRLVFQRARSEGKTLYFPRIIAPGEMVFLRVDYWEDMVPNKYGILEPKASAKEIDPSQLDVLIVPGVAFDRRGYRLGFGGGYYDRLLAKISSHTISVGFAYSFQVLDFIPVDEKDQKVARLVCENGFVPLTNTQILYKEGREK